MRRILLDMDGVIADFIGAAALLHEFDASAVKCWDFLESFGIDPVAFWSPMGRKFWANVPKTIEADAIVQACEEAVGAENVCLLSSPCDTDGCIDGKRDWIRKHYPQFARRAMFGPAKEFCAAPNRLLVDDSDSNCNAFARAGGVACLLPRPWNLNRGMHVLNHLHMVLAERF